MAAKVKKPTLKKQPGLKPGVPPGVSFVQPSIAGPPPAEIMTGIEPNPIRQGSERLHPLRFAVSGPPRQQLRPSSPFGVNVRNLVAEARDLDLDEHLLRRLATLPEDAQRELVSGVRLAGLPANDETYDRLLNTEVAVAIQPGSFTTQEFANLAKQAIPAEDVPFGTDSQYEQAEAIVKPVDPENPTPEEFALIQGFARDIATDYLLETGQIYQGTMPDIYAPAEQFFEAEQEE